jgi:hypothetical protein
MCAQFVKFQPKNEIQVDVIAKLFTFSKKESKKEELNEDNYINNYFLQQTSKHHSTSTICSMGS